MMIQLLFLLSVCWGAKPYQKNTDLHIIGKYHTTKTGEKAEFLLDVTDVTGTETLQPSDYSFIAQGQSNGQPWEIPNF